MNEFEVIEFRGTIFYGVGKCTKVNKLLFGLSHQKTFVATHSLHWAKRSVQLFNLDSD